MRLFRDAVGATLTFAFTSGVFLTPLVVALSQTLPTVSVELPEIERVVTIDLDGLLGPELVEVDDVDPPALEAAEEPAHAPAAPSLAAAPAPTPTPAPTQVASHTPAPPPARELVDLARVEKVVVPVEDASTEDTPEPAVAKAPRKRPTREPEPEPAPIRTVDDLKRATLDQERREAEAIAVLRAADELQRQAPSVDSCKEPHPDILKLGTNEFMVDREIIEYYTSSMERFNSLGWSHAYKPDEGEEKGWEIGGFGCKSPLWKGGLRSRDVVQAINGRKTNNVLQILAIWATMKKYGTFEVQVLRKGKVVTLRYKVV